MDFQVAFLFLFVSHQCLFSDCFDCCTFICWVGKELVLERLGKEPLLPERLKISTLKELVLAGKAEEPTLKESVLQNPVILSLVSLLSNQNSIQKSLGCC
jgi:hypothetical protein